MSELSDNPTPSSSTTSSFPMEDTQRRRSTIGPRDPTEALVSLQAASVQLETAYRRMRQVRRNIAELTDSNATADSARQGSASIGPGHEAITLTSGTENTDTGRRTPASTAALTRSTLQSMQEQLRRIENRIEAEIRRTSSRYGELFSPTVGSPASQASSTNSQANSQADSSELRRPALGSLRTTNLDGAEGSTSLGRRVALREMAGSVTSPSSSTSASSLRREQTLEALTSAAERSAEMLESLRRQLDGRTDLPPQSPTAGSSTSSGPDPSVNSRRSLYVARSSTRSDSSNSSVAEVARRRRIYGTTSSTLSQSPMTSEPDSRLSLLSNFSVQNLPTPVSGSSPRALIFEEPASYVPADFVTPASNTRSEPIRESQDERSYVVRRRYNADGQEFVHSINMEWVDDDDDDPMAWMLSRESQEELGLEVINTRVGGPRPRRRHALHQGSASRRRTWVRLDADGDEIIEEEPVFERPSQRYLVQVNPRPYAPIPAGFLDNQETMPLLAADYQHMDVPRIRVPRPPGMAKSDSNSTVRPDTSPKPSLSAKPVYVNPLPMPIESMVQTSHNTKPGRMVRLPKHATFACR